MRTHETIDLSAIDFDGEMFLTILTDMSLVEWSNDENEATLTKKGREIFGDKNPHMIEGITLTISKIEDN